MEADRIAQQIDSDFRRILQGEQAPRVDPVAAYPLLVAGLRAARLALHDSDPERRFAAATLIASALEFVGEAGL